LKLFKRSPPPLGKLAEISPSLWQIIRRHL
jgi:hypothetical protein